MNQFKSNISDETILIKTKYAHTYSASNFIHWILSSNHIDSLRLEAGDRRFAVFLVSEIFKENTEYFNKLAEILESTEIAKHFYSFFSQFEISMNLKIINTEIINEIKQLSLPTAVKFYQT